MTAPNCLSIITLPLLGNYLHIKCN